MDLLIDITQIVAGFVVGYATRLFSERIVGEFVVRRRSERKPTG